MTEDTNSTGPDAAARQRIERFAHELQELRHDAGRPSYDWIADHADVSKTTLSRAFAGSSLPSWPTTAAILRACGLDQEEMRHWRTTWSEISKLVKGVNPAPHHDHVGAAAPPRAVKGPTPTPTTSCPECGALVVDHESHQRWHREWIRRPERPLKVVTGPGETG